jgi:RNA polymerase sigma-70 factor (ECF subfamily)
MLNFSAGILELTDISALHEGGVPEEVSTPESTAAEDSALDTSDGRLAAFLEITQQRRAQLFRLAFRFANNREEAEDIVQEALLKAFMHLPEFRGESQMSTWLGVIVLNVGREWVRKRKGRVFLPLEYVGNNDGDPMVFDLPDPSRNPEQSYEHKEMNNILLSEIDDLDTVCKQTMRMCALDGLSHLEAANALGVNVLTIKSRIFRGKRMLKQRMCLRGDTRNDLSQFMETAF